VVKLHLDTDLGGDIDDLCALGMLLDWPGVELLAVTTVADDRGRRAGAARYALDLAGRRRSRPRLLFACAIALGWEQGVEIEQIPLRFEMSDGWLWQRVEEGGVLTRVVTRVDGDRFSAFWLEQQAGS
jgi:hypothetical protein